MVSQVVFLLNILIFRLWVTIQPYNYFSLRNLKMFSFYNLFSLELLATLGVTLKLEITEQIVLVDNAKKFKMYCFVENLNLKNYKNWVSRWM